MAGQPQHQTPRFTDQLAAWVDAHVRWIAALIGVIYVLAFSPHWRIGSDSALYMTLGRNIAEGAGYTYHGQPHDLVYPLLPWIVAGVWQITHVGDILALNVVMLAAHLLALGLIYYAMKCRFDRATAAIVVALTAVAASVFPYAFQVMSDPPFFLGVAALLAGYEGWRVDRSAISPTRARWTWLGFMALFVAGLTVAIFARPTSLPILVAVLFTAALGLWRGPLRVRHAIAGIGALLGAVLFYLLDPRRTAEQGSLTGDYESTQVERLTSPLSMIERALDIPVPMWFDAHATEALVSIDLGPGISWIFGALVIVLGLSLFRFRFLWGAIFALTAAMLLVTQPIVRYFMPITPLLALAWWQAARWIDSRWSHPRGAIVAGLMLILWVGGNLGETVIDYTIEQRHITGQLATYPDPYYRRLSGIKNAIETHTANNAIVISPQPEELTYFTDRQVVFPHQHLSSAETARPIYAVLPPASKSPLLQGEPRFEPGPVLKTVKIDEETHWRFCRLNEPRKHTGRIASNGKHHVSTTHNEKIKPAGP